MTQTLETLAPVFTAANEGEWLDFGDHRGRILVSSAQSGGFLLAEVEVDYLGGVPSHIHSREDETFYILDGVFEMKIGDMETRATVGDTAFGPRGVAHTWRCTSENGGRLVILVTPGENFESFALQMGAQNITPLDPNSIPILCALAEEHGMTMLPPEM